MDRQRVETFIPSMRRTTQRVSVRWGKHAKGRKLCAHPQEQRTRTTHRMSVEQPTLRVRKTAYEASVRNIAKRT